MSKLALQLAQILSLSSTILIASAVSTEAFAANLPELHNNGAFNAVVQRDPKDPTLSVIANKNNALLIWKSFDIAAGHNVIFDHEKKEPVSFLNVVKGPSSSKIYGKVLVKEGNNGVNFYLINPNGITVGDTGIISGFDNVYLGTAKPTQELLDQFKNDGPTPITMDKLPSSRGMGKVSLLGLSQKNNNIKVNAGQIIIGDIESVFKADNAKTKLDLNSSIGRIDIGGKLDNKIDPNQNLTYRDYLQNNGLVAAKGNEVKSDGTHEKGKFIDHSKQTTIDSVDDLTNVVEKNLSGDYWLANDLDISAKNFKVLGKDNAEAFTGTLDGAFNSIKYNAKIEQGGDYGLFYQLDGAEVSNLKLNEVSFDLEPQAYDSNVTVGALASQIKDSKLSNVEVVNFKFIKTDVDDASHIGALTGKLTGNNSLNNVTASFEAYTDKFLAKKQEQGSQMKVGVLAGSADGTINKSGVVLGASSKIAALGDNKSGVTIATDYQSALQEALNNGMTQEEFDRHYVSSGEGDKLSFANKGFLKPFFIEDFNYTYDGNVHDYLELVNNEGFDLRDLFDHQNGLDYAQSNAGYHQFDLTTKKEADNNGHGFYFSYMYAGDTWDKNAGGSADLQDRTSRKDGLTGLATLNINKKKVKVDIADQIVNKGDKLVTDLNDKTLDNFDEVKNSIVGKDSLADLGITLSPSADNKHITGSSNSQNYEVEFVDGKLATAEPMIPIDPSTPIEPDKPVKPVDPIEPDKPIKPIKPIMPEVDNDNSGDLHKLISKCDNCEEFNEEASSALHIFGRDKRNIINPQDYSLAIFSALEQKVEEKNFGDYLLAFQEAYFDGAQKLGDEGKAYLAQAALGYDLEDDNSQVKSTTEISSSTMVLAKAQTDAKGVVSSDITPQGAVLAANTLGAQQGYEANSKEATPSVFAKLINAVSTSINEFLGTGDNSNDDDVKGVETITAQAKSAPSASAQDGGSAA